MQLLNLFITDAHFLVFCCFQGVKKGCIGNEWVNQMKQNLWTKTRKEFRSPVSLLVGTHKLKINLSNKSFLFPNSIPKKGSTLSHLKYSK